MVREEERGCERWRRGAGPELDRGQGRGSATPDNTCPDYAGRDKTCCRMKGSYISWLTFSSRWSLDSGRHAGKNKTGIQTSLRHLPTLLNTLHNTLCLLYICTFYALCAAHWRYFISSYSNYKFCLQFCMQNVLNFEIFSKTVTHPTQKEIYLSMLRHYLHL